MKCNLMPKSIQLEQKRQRINLCLRPVLILSLIIFLTSVISGVWFQQKTEAERVYYTDQAYPHVQQIQKQNHGENLMKKQMETVTTMEKNRIHWPIVLVCLAETKPQEGAVQTLSVKDRHVTIEGLASSASFSRMWQERLRHQPCIAAVSISKVTGQLKNTQAFRLEVEVQSDGTISETA